MEEQSLPERSPISLFNIFNKIFGLKSVFGRLIRMCIKFLS
jgi:hypothetical protein